MQMQTAINTDIMHDFFPFFKVLKDGSVERCKPIVKMPPRDDLDTGVRCKDVIISAKPTAAVSARMFMPRISDPDTKLPVLVYFHGGGFALGSAFGPVYHNHMSSVAAKANALAVSVEYRLAPEHPIPACYDDAWVSLRWMTTHASGNGPDPWLNSHADMGRVFLAGDSAGANIMHNAAVRAGQSGLTGMKVAGLALVHPFFGGVYSKSDKMWSYLCPGNGGLEDPRLRPGPSEIGSIDCEKVMVFVAEKDDYSGAGVWYYKQLKKSEWRGSVDIVRSKGVGHVFHLFRPKCEQAVHLVDRLVSFINEDSYVPLSRNL